MEEDERREAAIASSPCLRPNFQSPGVTEEQLKKFQELHRRRLQIKSKSKSKLKRQKDGKNKLKEKELDSKHCPEQNADHQENDSGVVSSKGNDKNTTSSSQVGFYDILKKKPKLHWGYSCPFAKLALKLLFYDWGDHESKIHCCFDFDFIIHVL